MEPAGPGALTNDVEELLRSGINAAKSGQRERARDLLTQVVDRDENNLTAWLWLSGVVDQLEEREICLDNVLTLDPGNEPAQKGLELLRRQRAETWLRDGVAAAKTGQRAEAQRLLGRYVEHKSDNPVAWLWLSGVVDDLAERQRYLENALALDPGSEAAQKGLALLRAQEPDLAPPVQVPPFTDVMPESPVVARAQTPISPAAAILREQYLAQLPDESEAEPEPAPVASPVWNDLEYDYGCPYCATPTEPDANRCPSCGNNLWVKFRAREKRSTLLWVVIAFQFFSTLQFLLAPIALVFYVSFMLSLQFMQNVEMTDVLYAYLGMRDALTPAMVEYAFRAIPPLVVYVAALPGLFSLVVLVGLYLRWRPVYYLFVVDAVLELLASVGSMILTSNYIFGLFGVGLSLLRVFLIFQLGEDFRIDKRRILLRPDKGLSAGAAFLIAGEEYAKRRMWALAALHMRRAAGQLPDGIGSRLALALACIRMNRLDMAELAMEEARQIQPDHPKVAELAALLAEMGSPGAPSGAAA